ncbi:MAG: hypothetical protein WCK98_06615 [bacterium]
MFRHILAKFLTILVVLITLGSSQSMQALASNVPSEKISPVLEKVNTLGENKFEALFGYSNSNPSMVNIPIGDNNSFNPEPKDRGQTTKFLAGRQYGTFKTSINCGQTLVWTLKSPNGKSATSTATAPICIKPIEEKVTICHQEGDDDKQNSIEVNKSALDSHLAHGDYLGKCKPKPVDTTPATGSLKFLENPTILADNKIISPVQACYALTKLSGDENSGKISLLQNYGGSNQKEITLSDDFAELSGYVYLSSIAKDGQLVFKFYLKKNRQTQEILSTDSSKVEIARLGQTSWKITLKNPEKEDFEEDDSDDDSNDSENDDSSEQDSDQEVKNSNRDDDNSNDSETEDAKTTTILISQADCVDKPIASTELQPKETPDSSIVFSRRNSVQIVNFATDPVNPKDEVGRQAVNKIVGVKFLDENGTPRQPRSESSFGKGISNSLPTLSRCNEENCKLNNKSKLDSSYFAWNGTNVWQELQTKSDKLYTRSFEVVDYFGNKTVVKNSFVRDTTAPVFKDLKLISAATNIKANSTYTLLNKLQFNLNDVGLTQAQQARLPLADSQTLTYSYSFDNQTFTEWRKAVQGDNSVLVNFPGNLDSRLLGKDLKLFVKFQDQIGNTTPVQSASIKFEVTKPEAKLVLNNGVKITANSLIPFEATINSSVNLNKLRIAQSLDLLQNQSYQDVDIQNSDSSTILSYKSSFDFTKPIGADPISGKLKGDYTLCIQFQNIFDQESDPVCDSLKIDQYPATGEVKINNGDEQADNSKTNVGLNVTADNSKAEDISYRISTDNQTWSDWKTGLAAVQGQTSKFSANFEYDFAKFLGKQTIYVQFKNQFGTISDSTFDSIYINPFSDKLNIQIDDGAYKTEQNRVSINNPIKIVAINKEDLKKVKVRLAQTPNSNEPASDANIWTDWFEYTDIASWNVWSGTPKGQIYLHLQYQLPGENSPTLSRIYTDSIDYLPNYDLGKPTTLIEPDPKQEISCNNPYGWIEDKTQRTETTKSFWVAKSGITNPGNPKDNLYNFDSIVCSYSDKVHYKDDSSRWWENIDNRLTQLPQNSKEVADGYIYKNTANDFTVYFGDNTDKGWWYFSNDLDMKVDKVTIGGGWLI